MTKRTHIEDLQRTLPQDKLEKIREIDEADASLYSMLERFTAELREARARLSLQKAPDPG
jgi:hypothetical protein